MMSSINPWILLFFSIIFEVIGTLSLKYSSLNSSWLFGAITAITYSLAFYIMWEVTKKLDASVTYAVWSGVGIILITIFSWLIFKETMTLIKLASIFLILIGVIGLKLTSN